jgi:type I restriction enzyme S subunit
VVPVDNKLVDPSFLAYWIGSDASQRWLGRVEKGVAYVGINIEDLRNLPIGVPSMEEQQEIVRRVETLFAYADRLEARYQAARAQVERVTPALLAKAFRGELVPQDPDNEPASILLDRIRSARAAEPARPRQRKGGRRSGKTQKAEPIMLNRQDIERNHLTAILKERGPLTAEALWSASQLGIDDFYDQLKAEEAHGLLMERRGDAPLSPRLLEAAA